MAISPTENTFGVTFSNRKPICYFSLVSHILSHSSSGVSEGEEGLSALYISFPPELSVCPYVVF